MTGQRPQPPLAAFGALQRFVRRPSAEEQCELCGSALRTEHDHLLDTAKHRLVCACQPCAILFSGQAIQRYKRVPSRVRALPDFHLTDAQWDSLLVPIAMAFFFRNGSQDKMMAMYPSPAGPTESLLPLETWEQIGAENPVLQTMEPDVEALLVNRLGEQRGFPQHQYFLLPIDQCFKLVGLVRTHWRGLSGGTALWEELTRYFESLNSVATVAGERAHA